MLRLVGSLSLLVVLTACASAGGRVALPPATPEECARWAQGFWPEGANTVAAFDSLFEVAQRRQPREPQDPTRRMDRMPALTNGRAIANFISTAYPRDLLLMRRGGTAMMAVLVTTEGEPARVRVFRTSGIRSLDDASIYAAEQFRFSPGIFRGCPIYTFVMMPITWDPGPPPQGAR